MKIAEWFYCIAGCFYIVGGVLYIISYIKSERYWKRRVQEAHQRGCEWAIGLIKNRLEYRLAKKDETEDE